jgi:hypothetical protein
MSLGFRPWCDCKRTAVRMAIAYIEQTRHLVWGIGADREPPHWPIGLTTYMAHSILHAEKELTSPAP